ncbi:DUF4091 domain-containing protein [Deminuibacter soli]|uniref:DUF4091 domain-containing protein n=1 Tax=Deminuibacter soli TaxID=2291815 RepID=A0A3E1NFS7_9BACT|nr:DUF4091 domain-containing protein [Deminuibacter soli]RFM26664.1 DUF4091 domain-containing protein [Deminuibacter soli]
MIFFNKIKTTRHIAVWVQTLFALPAIFIGVSSASCQLNEAHASGITISYQHSLEKIFRESNLGKTDTLPVIDVAKGEVASLQYIINGDKDITDVDVHFNSNEQNKDILSGARAYYEGFVRAMIFADKRSRDFLPAHDNEYPDPLYSFPCKQITANQNQPCWISIPVGANAKTGDYKCSVTFTGKYKGQSFMLTRRFIVKVYPVVLSKDDILSVSNWFAFETPQNEYKKTFKRMNAGADVPYNSELYWGYLKKYAAIMSAHGQNVFYLSPVHLVTYKRDGNKWGFDFSFFDKVAGTLQANTKLKFIEGGALALRGNGWEGNFRMLFPHQENGTWGVGLQDLSNPDVQQFYKAFMPALCAHLKEKGWDKIYIQHIADEPIDANADSYISISKFIRAQLTCNLKFIDAVQTTKVAGYVDIWVPQLDFFDKNAAFFENRRRSYNETVWFYTSAFPQGNYANRFIELPLAKVRLLHWINFKYNASGYLHWGFNFWDDNLLMQHKSGSDGLPAGDAWIVYPGNNEVLSSIRFETMRDGINDYTLLRMLQKQNAAAAQVLVNKIVLSYDNYNTDAATILAIHKQLLVALSK